MDTLGTAETQNGVTLQEAIDGIWKALEGAYGQALVHNQDTEFVLRSLGALPSWEVGDERAD